MSPTAVPFNTLALDKTVFHITTSVGRCLQTYRFNRGLNLVFMTRPQTQRTITATYSWKRKKFAAWGGDDNETENSDQGPKDGDDGPSQGIWVFQGGRKTGELPMPADLHEPIRQILVFGAWIVGLARTRIEVWQSATSEHYTTLHPAPSTAPGGGDGSGGSLLTGGMCTMPTFLNKIFVGRADGWVEIWNVSSGKLVYTIVPPNRKAGARGNDKSSNYPGAVTCLEPTPALGLLAIAYAAGPLIVHDVLRDQPMLYVEAGTVGAGGGDSDDDEEDSSAPVTSISFRQDGRGAGSDGRLEGVMATATTASGDVTFWDLNKGGRITGVLRGAHNPPSAQVLGSEGSGQTQTPVVRGGISRIEFLPGQPVIVTSGLDNALRTWIFDETPFRATPRVLHTRSGHAAPINCLAFLPNDTDAGVDAGNKWLLSGGLDRSLWGWSLRRDGKSAELTQGHLRARAKKAGLLSATMLRDGAGAGPSSITTLEDLKAPPITCIAMSMNRDGGMGAIPGKLPIWQHVEASSKGGRDASARRLRPGDTEASGMTGWESVVTAHRGDPWARTWFWGRRRAGRWAFAAGDHKPVSTVAVSGCGSFALVGTTGGAIDMFNLQSGIHRQRFPSKLTPAQARQLKVQQQLRQADAVAQLQTAATMGGDDGSGGGGHTKAVTGIVVDSLNAAVVSCSLDGTVKFWDFLTGHLLDQIGGWPSPDGAERMVPIHALRYHAANDLLAFACGDAAIRVVDLVTRKTIRVLRLPDRATTINDLCFSNDGRWVVAVSREDARLRVWDLPTSHLIDAVVLGRAGRAVAFSGTGEFLAVAPEGALGVQLFTNKTLFRHVPTRPVVEEPATKPGDGRAILAPTVSGEGGAGILEAAFEDDEDEDDDNSDPDALPPSIVDQLSADMTTLSLVPKARWQTLLHLDLIKQRNRPQQAPKLPAKAPFFLGTVGSAEAEGGGLGSTVATTTMTTTGTAVAPDDARSRILTLDHTRAPQAFTMKLHQGETGDCRSPPFLPDRFSI